MSNRTAPRHPLKSICEAWLGKIDAAIKHRDEVFGQYARECERFFDEKTGKTMWDMASKSTGGPGGFLDANTMMPKFRITVNKLFEAVTLFGPSLYHQNPDINIEAVLPPQIAPEALGIDSQDPMGMQQYQMMAMQEKGQHEIRKSCAAVKSHYVNWLQGETDKRTTSRDAIQDAIVSGVGITLTEMYAPPTSSIKLPRSRRIKWEDVVVDPDATDWEGVEWIAIRWCQAKNRVAEKFGIEEEDLDGTAQSYGAQATDQGKREAKNGQKGISYDLIEYWEIFSKNGLGDRLSNVAGMAQKREDREFNFDLLGDFCSLSIARGIPFPLNLPSTVLTQEVSPDDPAASEAILEDVKARVQWPVSYWYDSVHPRGGWPICMLGFVNGTDGIWPMPIGKAAMGELRFVNWVLSFLADKVASSCTTYLAMAKSAEIELQTQINGKATPFVVLKVPEVLQQDLTKLVAFLNAPTFSADIWNMIAQVLDLIDKRTGLTELLYGLTSRQIRSATEASAKEASTSIRPDDMASRVEDWLTEIAVREIQAAQWFCTPEDVMPSVGQMGAQVWAQHVMTQPVENVVRGFNYTVAAGSARKPNKGNRIAMLSELGQFSMQAFSQLAVQGNPGPFNAYMADMANALDLDSSRYMIEPPPPPEQQGPSPEQIALEAKMKELELKMAGMQAQLQFAQEKHNQELIFAAENHDLDIEAQKEKNAIAADAAKKAANKPKPAGAK